MPDTKTNPANEGENHSRTAEAASPGKSEAPNAPRLYPEDQDRVDEFVTRGVNSVERKPFRPLRLMLLLIAIVMILSLFSQWLARWAGVT